METGTIAHLLGGFYDDTSRNFLHRLGIIFLLLFVRLSLHLSLFELPRALSLLADTLLDAVQVLLLFAFTVVPFLLGMLTGLLGVLEHLGGTLTNFPLVLLVQPSLLSHLESLLLLFLLSPALAFPRHLPFPLELLLHGPLGLPDSNQIVLHRYRDGRITGALVIARRNRMEASLRVVDLAGGTLTVHHGTLVTAKQRRRSLLHFVFESGPLCFFLLKLGHLMRCIVPLVLGHSLLALYACYFFGLLPPLLFLFARLVNGRQTTRHSHLLIARLLPALLESRTLALLSGLLS